MKTLLASAALAAACPVTFAVTFAATPAAAAPQQHSVVVRTADLDLSTRTGAIRLDRRVYRAAVAVCGTTGSFDLAGQNAIRRCVANAHRAARPASTIAITSKDEVGLPQRRGAGNGEGKIGDTVMVDIALDQKTRRD